MTRDEAILIFIADYRREYTCGPSIRDIIDGVNDRFPYMSTSVASYNLDKLERNGFIVRMYGRNGERLNRSTMLTTAGCWRLYRR